MNLVRQPVQHRTCQSLRAAYFCPVLERQVCRNDQALSFIGSADDLKQQLRTSFAEAKTQHGLRRAVRRGLSNVAIQAYLTAAVINLKRLATYVGGLGSIIRLYFECIAIYLAVRTLWNEMREEIRSKPFSAKLAMAA